MRIRNQIAACALLMMVGFSAMADNEDKTSKFIGKLTGFEETPAILSNGTGIFVSTVDETDTTLSYTLTFSALSSNPTVAHIHFGQMGIAGGPIAFLCGGGGKPICPVGGGTVKGTLVAADVLAIPSQGISAGNFTQFLNVMRSNIAYVNVHSSLHPAGEIRGQTKALLHDERVE